ncbi:MAG TPA: PilZ domain-containing protein [Desulfobulbus sp.]|nr:PilZ domain-containing protein [Desulfobulbus sp.]
MSSNTRPAELRNHTRYPIKNDIFLVVQGCMPGTPLSVTDLSKGGVGLSVNDEIHDLADKYVLVDLISESNQIILRSLATRVVFGSMPDGNGGDTVDSAGRYGLQFVHLSPLQKRQLGMITKKYARSRRESALPCRSTGLMPMVPWQGMPK